MQKKMVCLLVFLIASSYVFVFLFDTVNAVGSNIFVDGDNAVGPWDGSHDHPFQFIQEGIDAVTENGTVYVFAGIYRGNIVINKTINVNGSGKGNVIIDGSGLEDVVNISADHVTVRGFTIKNCTYGIRIYNSSDSIITENTIRDTDYGIFLGSVFNNFIYNNNFLNNTQNACDLGSNIWDAGYLSGGNYWDDYTGVDGNGDGFGDTPYSIAGNVSLDKHPLMKPFTVSPVADFIYSPSNPTTQDVIQFTDKSVDSDGYVVSWFWDFGDGTNSKNPNPMHRYVDDGAYVVTLNVVDESGEKNVTFQRVAVLNVKPMASFAYSPFIPTDLQIMTFNDTSDDLDGYIVSWFWDFGDGTVSMLQNATHQYVDNGSYIVTLSVVDDDEAVNEVSRQISVLNVGPIARFTFSPFLPTINDTIQFTDTSIDNDGTMVSWSWDFGDKTTSDMRSPAHNYTAGGTYLVSLKVTDNDGVSDTETEYVTIFISPTHGEDLKGSPLFDYIVFIFLGIAIIIIILVIRKYA